MFSNRASLAVLSAMVVALGCSEESATAPAGPATPIPTDLRFTLPSVSPATFAHAVSEEVVPGSGPARVLDDGSELPDSPTTTEMGQIFNATTKVGFETGYAYSSGRHSYVGNTGKVSTEAVVSFEGHVLGRQPASRQSYVPFLSDFGQIKEIWADAYVFSDEECGLSVNGSSEHRAWWQWFLVVASTWGEVYTTSQAFPPASQPACTDPDGFYSGGSAYDTGGGGDPTCWYLVTYDPYTGEVYDAEFLYCDNVEGG